MGLSFLLNAPKRLADVLQIIPKGVGETFREAKGLAVFEKHDIVLKGDNRAKGEGGFIGDELAAEKVVGLHGLRSFRVCGLLWVLEALDTLHEAMFRYA